MAALPIAMIGATVLGLGAGWASLHAGESERDSIQLQSGQHVRIQSRVRLSEDGKKNHPDSCLIASEDGTITKIDIAGRKATVRCNKNRRAAPEEIPADDLEVIDSGVNAPGISIPGGYLTEGSSVRMLDSSKRTNKGKALASPFYNPVGTVMVIDKVAKQVVVLSNHLNNKSTAQEYYNIDDLEFVSGPSADARKGAEAGLALRIGSTVELTEDAKKKYAPGVVNNTFNKPPEKKLADPKWEKFGLVKSITIDTKNAKNKIVIVRCVSKDSKKEVLEQKYDFDDLKAIQAISVERAGIAVFGGMAEIDTKVKLRAERKSAVASKSLGRSAFGDVGTVSDLEPNDPNNLKVFVTCNGINPDEQTGDWYQPEDLELAEPEDTEGEAVFGGRVVVGSTVRVMQSARGKKCLGTPEFGDVGTVKGIDPSAADNLKINVTCGRTDAKQSEWYDPRDLSLYFPVDESGSDLEKAKVALAAAQKELSAWQLRPQEERRSDKGRAAKKELEDKVAAAQAEVDRLSGVGLDKTKANEMRNDSEEKLDEALKLKRELEAVRLKLSRDSTCKKPELSEKYADLTEKVVVGWMKSNDIDFSSYKDIATTAGTKPLQYSNSYRVAFTELQTAFAFYGDAQFDSDTANKYNKLNLAKLALREDLKKNRSDTESFSNLDDMLLDVAKKQKAFDDIKPPTPYKSALQTVDDKLKKLQEVTTQIQSAAYSGDSPAEKLLKRVEDLEKKTNADITDNATDLGKAVTTYDNAFKSEQEAKLVLELNKHMYDDYVNKLKKKDHTITPDEDTRITELFNDLNNSRIAYLNAQKETLKARKAQALLSAKTTCSEITLESVKDMKSKIQKIIDGKCGVLTTIDDLLDQVNDLISKRKRAFTMSQAVLDPKFGDPNNAIFDTPITSPEDRIAEIEAAMAAIKSLEPSDGGEMKKLQRLIDLCGTYRDDTLLPEAKAIKPFPPAPPNNCPPNPGNAPAAPEGVKPKNPFRLNADAPEFVPPAAPRTPPITPPGTPEESEEDEPPPPPPPPPPAPAQPIHQCPSNLDGLRELVQNYIYEMGFKMHGKDFVKVQSQTGVKYPIEGMPAVLAEWQPIATSGNNSDCLIHTILTQLSPDFRRLGDNNKNTVATWFRTQILTTVPEIMQDSESMRRLTTPGLYLENHEIQSVSNCWRINFYAVGIEGVGQNQYRINPQLIGDQYFPEIGQEVYIIVNNGGQHYQPLRSPTGEYALPWIQILQFTQPQTINGISIPADLNCNYEIGDIVVYRNNSAGPRFTVTERRFPGNDGRQDCTDVKLNNEYGVDVGFVPVGDIIKAPATAGKRKWPFYGRRTTRRNQRGGVEQSDVVKAKAVYDAATETLKKYEAAVKYGREKLRSGNINPNDPQEKAIIDKVKDINTVKGALTKYKADQASAYATYVDLQEKLEEENQVNPFRPPPPPPPAPLTQSQRFSNLVAQDETLPNMADDVPDVNPFASAPAPAQAPVPVRSQSQRFRDLAAGPQSQRAVTAPAPDVPEVNPFASAPAPPQAPVPVASQSQRFRDLAAGPDVPEANPFKTVPSDTVNVNPFATTKQTQSQRFQNLATRRNPSLKKEVNPFAPAKKSESQRFRDLVEEGRKSEEKVKAKAAEKAAEKAKIAADKAAAKQAEYEGRYKAWRTARDLFDKCYAKYVADKQRWLQERQNWSDKLIKVTEALSSDQILRLQSRGVGSSLMLDEARKLMIDADAQQRTVMESKTDLQFTLASSSDADIAKAVGFYEAELQKLKTCISKGKEDAIAEYDKDLADIEKRKREITTKTFEVKAPQEDKKNKKLEDMNLDELYAERTRVKEERKKRLDRKSNANVQDLDERIRKIDARISNLKSSSPAPAPTPGGRRMTMRRRRV